MDPSHELHEVGAPDALVAGTVDAVLDDSIGAEIGDTVTVNGIDMKVVGTVEGVRFYGGQPAIFVPIAVAQRLVFGG